MPNKGTCGLIAKVEVGHYLQHALHIAVNMVKKVLFFYWKMPMLVVF